MHQVLRWDMGQLLSDVNEIEKGLEMVGQDPIGLLMGGQQSNLTQLVDHIKRLDLDLNITLSDCVSLGHQFWKVHNLMVIDSLRRSLCILSNVLNDLEKIRTGLSETYINPSVLWKLGRDWGRFKRSIGLVQKAVKHIQRRRKRHTWARHSPRKAYKVTE